MISIDIFSGDRMKEKIRGISFIGGGNHRPAISH
jgi:hypothetical protein